MWLWYCEVVGALRLGESTRLERLNRIVSPPIALLLLKL